MVSSLLQSRRKDQPRRTHVYCDVLLSICVLSVTSQPYNKRERDEEQVFHLAFYGFLSLCDETVMHSRLLLCLAVL